MSSLKLITDAAIRLALGTRCHTKVVAAINLGGAATIKTTNGAVISVDGVFASLSALAAQSIAVTHGLGGVAVASGPNAYVQPVSTTVYYIVAQNLAGTVAFVQGGYSGQVVTLPAGVSFTSQGEMPLVPANYAPIAILKVATGAAATFTPGTTALDAAGVTVTYTDIALLPTTNP